MTKKNIIKDYKDTELMQIYTYTFIYIFINLTYPLYSNVSTSVNNTSILEATELARQTSNPFSADLTHLIISSLQ